MASQKISDLELIKAYRLQAPARRLSSKLAMPAFNSSREAPVGEIVDANPEAPRANKAAPTEVVVSSRDGIVTVVLGNSKPVSQFNDKMKVLGRSKISIPEYKIYRK